MSIRTLINFSAGDPNHVASLMLVAAKKGDSVAQAKLGQMLLDGHGILQDASLAIRWFYISSQSGCLQAINMLGRCYENGWGCKVNYQKAAYYYQLAAEKEFSWGLYNLANLLTKGYGVAKDLQQAFNFYLQAACQGHAKSMNLVGRFYEEGWLFSPNLDKAIDWYRRSACAGDFRGQCSYASILTAQGHIDEAVLWLRHSLQTATQGFLQKMARALWQSPHQALREISIEIFELCAEQGDSEDQQAYQQIIQQQAIGGENATTNF